MWFFSLPLVAIPSPAHPPNPTGLLSPSRPSQVSSEVADGELRSLLSHLSIPLLTNPHKHLHIQALVRTSPPCSAQPHPGHSKATQRAWQEAAWGYLGAESCSSTQKQDPRVVPLPLEQPRLCQHSCCKGTLIHTLIFADFFHQHNHPLAVSYSKPTQ